MILFLQGHEPDKINLYSKMRQSCEELGYSVTNLTFNFFEKYIYKKNGVTSQNVNSIRYSKLEEYKKYSKEDIDNILLFETKLSEYRNTPFNINKFHSKVFHFLEVLNQLSMQKKIDCIFLWNNNFLYDRIAYFFAIRNNIKYIMLEQGYFRPFTLTADVKGVNNNSSIPRDQEFYLNYQVDKESLGADLTKPYKAVKGYKVTYNKLLYRLFFKISKLNVLNRYRKEYYKIKNNKKMVQSLGYDNKDDNKRYIFIPFQVETDSQMMFNSPYINTSLDLFLMVSKQIELYNSKFNDNIVAVFKIHPMDKLVDLDSIKDEEKKFPYSVLLESGDTNSFIQNTELVITINSTVGIEALMFGKKVISLGQAFYNIPGIVTNVEEINKLNQVINTELNNELNHELIRNFLYYLRFDYFYEIYWREPDIEDVKKIIHDLV